MEDPTCTARQNLWLSWSTSASLQPCSSHHMIQPSSSGHQLKQHSFFFFFFDTNQPWIYMCSPSQPPLPPPSLPDPSGSSQCTRPEHLSYASNLGWWSVSSLIIYLFRCCSLEPSHPRLLSQSLKVCSVHLCLFFCFAYRVIVAIFLNSIYMH